MPDSVLVAEQEMIARLLANLPSGFTSASVKLPNAPFTTPNAKWLRATMIPFAPIFTVATGKRQRTRGIFAIDVFYPLNSGSQAAWTTAEAIKAVFINQCTTNVMFYEVEIINGDDDDYYHVQVNINYAHEGTTT